MSAQDMVIYVSNHWAFLTIYSHLQQSLFSQEGECLCSVCDLAGSQSQCSTSELNALQFFVLDFGPSQSVAAVCKNLNTPCFTVSDQLLQFDNP